MYSANDLACHLGVSVINPIILWKDCWLANGERKTSMIGHGPSAKNVLKNKILIRTSGNQKILLDTLSTWIDCYFFMCAKSVNVHVKS